MERKSGNGRVRKGKRRKEQQDKRDGFTLVRVRREENGWNGRKRKSRRIAKGLEGIKRNGKRVCKIEEEKGNELTSTERKG